MITLQKSTAVTPINWGNFTTPYPTTPDATLAKELLQTALKYAVGDGYVNKYGPSTTGYIDFGNLNNRFIRHDIIRPPAMQALSIAIAIKLGVYSEDVAGKTEKEALEICTKLTRSLARCHKTIEPDIGWGIGWQDAWWAFVVGLTGWLTWEHYNAEDQSYIHRMIMMEADSFASINRRGLYYMDKTGEIIIPGDTKGEENAWDSNIRHLAYAMMPNHDHRFLWEYEGLLLNISSFAAPMDVCGASADNIVNGRKLRDWLEGSNAYDNGVVVNHDMIHPDYMAACGGNLFNACVLTLGGLPTPRGIFNGVARTYNALVNVKFDENYVLPPDTQKLGIQEAPAGIYGRTIYSYCDAACTQKSHVFYMPQGNDWGHVRQATMGGFDAMVNAFDMGTPCAHEWENIHMSQAKKMQSRFADGSMYGPGEVENFKPRQEQACLELAQAVFAKWTVAQKGYEVTDAPPRLLELL